MNNNEDIEKARGELFEDYLNLGDKYSDLMPCYEFGYALIRFNSKMLMGIAPSREVALATIKAACEAGIAWHDEEVVS